MGFRSACFLPIFVLIRVEAVPPEACFANFRWDDCGKSPIPVMYYWKPGSRCEVGLWRGCLPNLNMFPDEYECVTTCIFTARAMPEDYHSMNENEIEDLTEHATEVVTVEMSNATETTTGIVVTAGKDSGGATGATGAATVVTGGDKTAAQSNATVASDTAATAAGGGGGAATTAAPAA